MSRIIRRIQRAPSGFTVVVEIENAYVNGESRFVEITVPQDVFWNFTTNQRRAKAVIRAALRAILDDEAFDDIEGETI